MILLIFILSQTRPSGMKLDATHSAPATGRRSAALLDALVAKSDGKVQQDEDGNSVGQQAVSVV